MSTGFERLKEDSKSGKSFKAIYGLMSDESGTWTKTRIRRALAGLGYLDFANKITNCKKGQLCGQVYCSECRNRASLGMMSRVVSHIEGTYGSYNDNGREQFKHSTILCELVAFDEEAIRQSVVRARKDINAFRRRFKDIWFQGAFEFELLDINKLTIWGGKNQVKKQTLAAMDRVTGDSGERILVHFHGLMDLNGTDFSTVNKWVKDRWNDHPRQTYIQKTYDGQSLEDMSWKVSSYCFKNRVRDNMTFIAKDFEEGDYYTRDQLAKLVKLYDFIGGKKGFSGLLISFGN